MADKIKIIHQAKKLGMTYAGTNPSTEDLEDMMKVFIDRELKVSFLQGFEAELTTSHKVSDEMKNYIHYEMLRNKRA